MADSRTGAELFTDVLESYGVRYVFGNPGTTELPVMEALSGSELEYVLAPHEDIAVGMAAGYASTKNYRADEDGSPVGVVNLHVAPGVAHGLGNLYGASVTGAPLVVTAGAHSLDFRHEEPILSGDVLAMTEQFTKWSAEVTDVESVPTMLRRAFRVAQTPPTGPVFLSLPLDVMMDETDAEPERLGRIQNPGAGDPTAIARAAELLAEADDPVLVVGDHIPRHNAYSDADALDAAVRLAEATGARVHAEILACEVDFPGDHEQWVSHVPPDENIAAATMNSDTLVFAGCSTNTTLTRHDRDLVPDDATLIDLNDEPWQVGKNTPADVAVTGDLGLVMDELAEAVELSDDELAGRLERVRQFKEFAGQQMASMGEGSGDDPRASKAELVDTLRETLSSPYIVDEGITSKYVMLLRWPFERESYISNKGGGLGYGLPAAVGAAMAEAETDDPRRVVGFVGDGSYLYYPHTLYSAARYDVDLTVVVPDNRNYRILKDNTLKLFGGEDDDHEYVGMDFEPPVDIPTNAESHGASGYLVESPEDIAETLETALAEDGPSVVDVLVHD
ncbi:thiamine pyrophosphate protein domain protein TPP-binding protein [Haladaptatus paucihalophilus DX253]|uniref:Benzoylformate decarboxylase n=1 Tax=Haladaptatus paucihalophilus DX253 TaxID=797209 RepID=E7QRQ6_HALPU|nr:thiamine pyrophosphate-binding protein [Haladaptatus paucihalophilus]EFW92675.1 thiamine pyrophosphate protein domain protein TPP-binding protein [Haladaptatus paucihalophilus DX253]SHK16075.1 benzoylformate decarboxylase [Haladaptatus paucihalophilus DX253]